MISFYLQKHVVLYLTIFEQPSAAFSDWSLEVIGKGWSMTYARKVIYAPCKQQYMDTTKLGIVTSTYNVPYPSSAHSPSMTSALKLLDEMPNRDLL
jgi:hypothetical protein